MKFFAKKYLRYAAAILFLISSTAAFADTIESVTADGEIQIQGGELISLAGIVLPEESLPLLRTLLASREIDIEFDHIASSVIPRKVYLYLDTRELPLPFRDIEPKKHKVLLNRMLLELGAAKVTEQGFDKKNEFLEVNASVQFFLIFFAYLKFLLLESILGFRDCVIAILNL